MLLPKGLRRTGLSQPLLLTWIAATKECTNRRRQYNRSPVKEDVRPHFQQVPEFAPNGGLNCLLELGGGFLWDGAGGGAQI